MVCVGLFFSETERMLLLMISKVLHFHPKTNPVMEGFSPLETGPVKDKQSQPLVTVPRTDFHQNCVTAEGPV